MAVTAGTAAAQQPVRLMDVPCTATAVRARHRAEDGPDLHAGLPVRSEGRREADLHPEPPRRRVEPHLAAEGLSCLRLQGPLPPGDRHPVLADAELVGGGRCLPAEHRDVHRRKIRAEQRQAFWSPATPRWDDLTTSRLHRLFQVQGRRVPEPVRWPPRRRSRAGPCGCLAPAGQQAAAPRSATPSAQPPEPTCDFSHIFEIGQHEIVALPATSALAQNRNVAPG